MVQKLKGNANPKPLTCNDIPVPYSANTCSMTGVHTAIANILETVPSNHDHVKLLGVTVSSNLT